MNVQTGKADAVLMQAVLIQLDHIIVHASLDTLGMDLPAERTDCLIILMGSEQPSVTRILPLL